MGKNLGKNISKILNKKYWHLIRNKIADKIRKVWKSSSQNNSESETEVQK